MANAFPPRHADGAIPATGNLTLQSRADGPRANELCVSYRCGPPLIADVGWQIRGRGRIVITVEVPMHFTIEHEREEDGRWLAEVPELPGVLAYGATAQEAMAKVQALALRVLAERLENDEAGPQSISIAVA
jgi:predicted RNase H-like HicB family nuclease